MADDAEIECKFTATLADWVARCRYLWYRKSLPIVRGFAWIFSVVLLGLLIASIASLFGPSRPDEPGTRYLGLCIVCAAGIVAVLAGDWIRAYIVLMQTPDVVGDVAVRITPNFVYSRTIGAESYARWRAFSAVEFNRGDLYLLLNKRQAIRIPARAFGPPVDGARAYHLASQYQGAANIGSASAVTAPNAVESTDDVWPPSPRYIDNVIALPDIEPPIDTAVSLTYDFGPADQVHVYKATVLRRLGGLFIYIVILVAAVVVALDGIVDAGIPWLYAGLFALLIYGLMVASTYKVVRKSAAIIMNTAAEASARLVSDYVTIRTYTDRGVISLKASSFYRVDCDTSYVYLRQSPSVGAVVPIRAFASPAAARDFVDRLRAAKRAANR